MRGLRMIDPADAAGMNAARRQVPLAAVEALAPPSEAAPPLTALIDEIDRRDRERAKI